MFNLNQKIMICFKKLLSLFFVAGSIVVLSYCTTNEPDLKIVEPDIIKVSSRYYNDFNIAYQSFFSSLSNSQKDLLNSYVMDLEKELVNGRVAGATCNCGQGQNSCTASGVFGDCCICWSPATQNGACGVYFGVPSCQVEEKSIAGPGRTESIETIVTFYSKKFSEMIEFATINQINTKEIRAEFKKLKSFAILG
jgi:hypothetical protein